ncbi:hypothetical protein DAPPUDRAFT_270744 [Daphnia pulex]|uniref:Uncharacterized protein n=1 Tax=Daphnia pulex TaxID=6669 RepID=E9I187_DAPPU|nr:hypothetical protein DAPPUDRAFT_270744 [Daphnia pulex]|eukprot:EFX62243.1 hypothetical protein DAPPUDRAFT_270744 [Daphnia pulex]
MGIYMDHSLLQTEISELQKIELGDWNLKGPLARTQSNLNQEIQEGGSHNTTTANPIWNFATLTVVNVEKEEKPEPKVEPEEPLTTALSVVNKLVLSQPGQLELGRRILTTKYASGPSLVALIASSPDVASATPICNHECYEFRFVVNGVAAGCHYWPFANCDVLISTHPQQLHPAEGKASLHFLQSKVTEIISNNANFQSNMGIYMDHSLLQTEISELQKIELGDWNLKGPLARTQSNLNQEIQEGGSHNTTTANPIWNFATLTVVNVEKEEKPEPKVEPEEPLTTGITSANGTNFTFFKTGYCGVSLLTYD